MLASLLLCLAAIAVAIAILIRQGQSMGMPLAYLICLASIHLPGGLAHWLHPKIIAGYFETAEGLSITALSMLAFVAGMSCLGWLQRRKPQATASASQPLRLDPRFWRFCVTWGLGAGFVFAPLRIIPSIGTLVHNAGLLWIAGAVLAIRYHTSSKGSPLALQRWVLVSLISPFLSLFGQGFLGYGVTAITQLYSIFLVRRRRLLRAVAIVAIAFYLGLSVGVSYLATRNEIRDAVWGGGTTGERLRAIGYSVEQIKLFDPNDLQQAKLLDARLNQNFLVGAAASSIQAGLTQQLRGLTFIDSIIALIPRAIWPDKPDVAGSGFLVSNATGILFAEGVSVGIGNVMELYINFGFWGIAAGSASLGALLRWLDLRAYQAEAAGNYKLYLSALLPALALIQPGGSFAEVTSSMAAAWIAARFWFELWRRRQIKQQPMQPLSRGLPER